MFARSILPDTRYKLDKLFFFSHFVSYHAICPYCGAYASTFVRSNRQRECPIYTKVFSLRSINFKSFYVTFNIKNSTKKLLEQHDEYYDNILRRVHEPGSWRSTSTCLRLDVRLVSSFTSSTLVVLSVQDKRENYYGHREVLLDILLKHSQQGNHREHDAHRVIRHTCDEDKRARWASGAKQQGGPVEIASDLHPRSYVSGGLGYPRRSGEEYLCSSPGWRG